MANYESLKSAIQQVVRTNGNEEITGALLQQTLFAMVNSLGAGYQYAGIATQTTNPGTPDQNVFYLAATAGTYSNFGSIVLADGEVAILKYNGSWSKDVTGAISAEKFNPLYYEVDGFSSTFQTVGMQQDLSIPIPANRVIRNVTGGAWTSLNLWDENGENHITIYPSDLPYKTGVRYSKASTFISGFPVLSINVDGAIDTISEIESTVQQIKDSIDQLSIDDTVRTVENFGHLVKEFSPEIKLNTAVSSVNGSFVSVNGQKSVEIDLTGLPYTSLKFKTTTYGGNYGYGFFVDGVWQGVRTTSNADVQVPIPSGATIFRACWNATNVPENSYVGTAVNSSIGANDILENKDKIAELESEIGGISTSGIDTLLYAAKRNNIGSQYDFTKIGIYDYYAAFDELAYTYKDDFKIGENIGTSTTPEGARYTKDPNIYPIKRYTFKKPGSTPSKTIVLCGAIHGDSQSVEDGVIYNNNGEWYNDGGDSPQNILCQLFFFVDFLANHTRDTLYQNLYENYAIEVVPILNPWGVQNHSRANGRDVDVARNFDYNWTADTSYGHSSGTAPFSENESAAFRDFFNSLTGVQLCIECHARGNILIPASVQFLSVIPQTANSFQDAVSGIMANYITSRFNGTYSPQRSDTASLVNWVKNIKAVEGIEPEFAQTFSSNIYTRNTKLVNYQMTEMLKQLITRLVD